MLHELKDLVEKSLFTEVRIVKIERGDFFFSQELGIERNQRDYEETNELRDCVG